ncbi:MAG TPA: SpoIID/LytB domain-containing protein [Candidatus Angelobacter sp.]
MIGSSGHHHPSTPNGRRAGDPGHRVIGSSEDLCRRKFHPAFKSQIRNRKLQIYCFICFLFTTIPACSQAPKFKVRLYSLHSEQRIKITAKTGALNWKTCEQCEVKHAATLALELSAQAMKIEGETQPQKQILVEGDYRIEPSEGLPLSLNFPVEVKAEQKTLKVFLSLPQENYVAAALAGESGNFEHEESLKAMAVAVRTYAVHFRQRHASEGFDFCDSTHCQALNFKGISAQVRAAAEATRGEMLWYEGSPAATFYHQNCGGVIAAAKEAWPGLRAPYLKQQQDPYCVRGALLPWKAQIGRKELENALRAQGLAAPQAWSTLEIVARTPSGRALKLAFRGMPGDPDLISASSLRFAIGRSLGWNQVRSDLYDIQTTPESVVFMGRGAGHGVGLCQAGAEEMAKEGKSYRQILAFYYPGTALGISARGLTWQKTPGQRFEMLSVQPDQDAPVLQAAEKILPAMESELGWKLDFRPQLKVYPTLDAYRDSTGQPGWIAAFTRAQIIRLQPLAVLEKKSVLESTLRHEFTHLLIEMRAYKSTPVWFREGLVLYFAETNQNFQPVQMSAADLEKAFAHPDDRQQLERAYAAARTRVAQMVERNGKETVLRWLNEGLPPGN